MTSPTVSDSGAEPVSQVAARVLRFSLILTLVLAAVGLLPGPSGVVAGTAAVAVVTATPLLRVAWLAARWWRAGDHRYALIALALLSVVASGAIAALVAA